MLAALRRVALAAAFASVPAVAWAHPGAGAHTHDGFVGGMLHPLTGVDHLAAMVAVGLWAALLGGRAIALVPAAFLALLSAGAVLGATGVPVPGVEPMIAASVVALGLATALAFKVPAPVAAAIVGSFALFHGAAHGAEMPGGADPLAFAAGFLAATAVLHAVGLAVGLFLGRPNGSEAVVRVAGAGVAAVGLLLTAV